MKKLSLLFAIVFAAAFPPSVFAQEKLVPHNTIVRLGEPDPASSNQIQVRNFMQELIERDLRSEFTVTLKAKGFNDEQIETILKGAAFQNFIHRVSNHRRVTSAIDLFIRNLTEAPTETQEREYVHASFSAQRTMALKHFLVEKRIQGTAFRSTPPTGFANWLWRNAKALFFE